MDAEDVFQPLCYLPSQLTGHFELKPEQAMLEQLFFDCLQDLQCTYQSSYNFPYNRFQTKVAIQNDILDWVRGKKAKLTFKAAMNELGMEPAYIRRVIRKACKSWEETDGAKPDVHTIPRHSPNTDKNKPAPILTARYIASLSLPSQEKCFTVEEAA